VGRWAKAWNLCAAAQAEKTLYDGFRKHRSLALALSAAGMTYFLKPITTLTNHYAKKSLPFFEY
jgi:hypothetical protein